MGRKKIPIHLRFWNRVRKTEECWLWQGYIGRDGYGRALVDGRSRLVHRIAYGIMGYTVPKGYTLDHLCRIRHCVRPSHLEPVTLSENIARGNKLRAKYRKR